VTTTETIPPRWDDVDAAWMSRVLARRFPGAEVGGVSLAMCSDGSNRRARFAVDYTHGDGPAVVFVKAEGSHRQVHARNGNLFNESRLYASGVELAVDHPEPYAVIIDEPNLDWLVVMEDITARDGEPRDATQPLGVDQAANGVRGLARLHREHWGFSPATVPALRWVQTWAPTEGFRSGLAKRVPTGLERSADVLPEPVAALGAEGIVSLWARYVGLLAREPVTLLHGDAHIGNVYVLPDDDVGFLDWQVARRGNWSQDVGHFLQGSLITDHRRAHERTILGAYRAELDRGLSADDLWTWYRASAIYGLTIWLSTLGVDGYQTNEVSHTLVQRFAAAVVDLDTTAAIGGLERTETSR
jgi:hypothetical protein